MDDSLSYNVPRTCPKCKSTDAIPAGDTKSSCLCCREKRNEQKRDYYHRVKERESAAKRKIEHGQDDHTTTVKAVKRKRKQPTVEYQNANGLYKALRTTLRNASPTAMPSFDGCFSIISDPSVNHLDRARVVASDLKKVAKYPVGNTFSRDVSNARTNISSDCRCLTSLNVAESSRPHASVAAPAATVAAAPLQAASSHHLNSVVPSQAVIGANENGNGNKFVQALEASFERNCGGKVKISIQSDFSHPLGISGQKVTVKIVH